MKSNNEGNLILLSGAAVGSTLCCSIINRKLVVWEILRGTVDAPVQFISHPALCLIIKPKYCLFHQKITKFLFFVLTCDAYAHTF